MGYVQPKAQRFALSAGECGLWFGWPGPYAELSFDDAYVGVWSEKDNGDVPPKWTIGGPQWNFAHAARIALDVKNKNMLVSDERLNAVLTFHLPDIF